VFALGKPFKPSQMFASKAGAYSSDAPFKLFTIGYSTGLARDKRASLLQRILNSNHKKFYSSGTSDLYYKCFAIVV
jgi:hypothetical protein